MVVGLSTYLSKYFSHASSLGLLAAKCTCRQDVGSTGHKLKSQKCVCMGGRCLLPTRTWELETSYTLEEGHLKSLYSTQIIVSTGLTLPHANRIERKRIPSNRIEENKSETIVSKRKKLNRIQSNRKGLNRIALKRIESNRIEIN